ncbi:hypothetical protein ACFXO7_24055, partial [Nocardia tengchongensis]
MLEPETPVAPHPDIAHLAPLLGTWRGGGGGGVPAHAWVVVVGGGVFGRVGGGGGRGRRGAPARGG